MSTPDPSQPNDQNPSDDLIFMMGKYEARFPRDRLYSKHHVWAQEVAGATRFGFTAYSVRLLQDVYFLGWSVDANSQVKYKQEIGEVESSKAISSLYAPGPGMLTNFNPIVMNDPSAINTDPYGDGWLYELKTSDTFLTAEEYVDLLNSTWEETQRTIKGQINEG
jgi:glycine cleavage system H protein